MFYIPFACDKEGKRCLAPAKGSSTALLSHEDSLNKSKMYTLLKAIAGKKPRVIKEIKNASKAVVYQVDNEIIKFPKRHSTAEALRRESQILDFAQDKVDTPLPSMQCWFTNNPAHSLFYTRSSRLSGHVLSMKEFSRLPYSRKHNLFCQLSDFLIQLQNLDVGQLEKMGVPDRFGKTLPQLTGKGGFSFTAQLYNTACQRLEQWTKQGKKQEQRCLVHGDLLPTNFMVTPKAERVIGVIDFEFAAIGTPTSDFLMPQYGSDLGRFIQVYEAASGNKICHEKKQKYTLARFMAQTTSGLLTKITGKQIQRD